MRKQRSVMIEDIYLDLLLKEAKKEDRSMSFILNKILSIYYKK